MPNIAIPVPFTEQREEPMQALIKKAENGFVIKIVNTQETMIASDFKELGKILNKIF